MKPNDRRSGRIHALKTIQESRADAYRPRVDRGPGGGDYHLETIGGKPQHVAQPVEAALRFPSRTYNYGGEALLAQGAALAAVLTFTVPQQDNGVLRELVIYSTSPGGMADLTQLELLVNQNPVRGALVPGAAPASAILPQSAFEDPRLLYNLRLFSAATVELRLGRVGAVDPINYTYRFRVTGWFWPRYRGRRF